MSKLSRTDYITILNYYDLPIPDNNSILIKDAENILATKLCRCIKKVKAKQNNKKNEKRPIAICKNSIFGRRNLNISRFTCKSPALLSKKGEKRKLFKKGKLNITKKILRKIK